jgi:predicted metal-dependent hydrolase
MTELVVRRLLIDLETPFERHWNGGDPFRSAYFNALSMSFPVGEQFFIDSVRAGIQALPAERRASFEAQVQGFIGQEATHRRIHALFNRQLDRLGYLNAWEPRILKRLERMKALGDPRHAVAITAATARCRPARGTRRMPRCGAPTPRRRARTTASPGAAARRPAPADAAAGAARGSR